MGDVTDGAVEPKFDYPLRQILLANRKKKEEKITGT